MSAVEWGDKIAVTGKPAWLAGDVSMRWVKPDGAFNREGGPCLVRDHNWHSYVHTPNTATVAIRLPDDHFAYTAIAKGFEPWGGGDSAPEDWDGGEVLQFNGVEPNCSVPIRWKRGWGGISPNTPNDIIGYHKRQTATASDDTVMVKRMTEAEALERFEMQDCMAVLSQLGLIREPTKAERIATETGLTVEQVQSVLDAMENN